MQLLSEIQEPLNEHMLFRIIIDMFGKWTLTKRELQSLMGWRDAEMKNRVKSGDCPVYFKTTPTPQGQVRFHTLDVVKWYLLEIETT